MPKLTEAQLQARRDYQATWRENKRKEREAVERAATRAKNAPQVTNAGNRKSTPQERAANARAAWAAKRQAESAAALAERAQDLQVETKVNVPDDIQPGILGAGADNGIPPIPTGASLVAEVMASFRKLAISVKEAGATQGVFLFPDGTTFTVRSDGSVAVS